MQCQITIFAVQLFTTHVTKIVTILTRIFTIDAPLLLLLIGIWFQTMKKFSIRAEYITIIQYVADFSGSQREMTLHWTYLAMMNNIGQIVGGLVVGEFRKYISFPLLMLISQASCCIAFAYFLLFAKHVVPQTSKKSQQSIGQQCSEALQTLIKKRDGNSRVYIWVLLLVSFTGGLQLYGLPLLLAIYTVPYWAVIVSELCYVTFCIQTQYLTRWTFTWTGSKISQIFTIVH